MAIPWFIQHTKPVGEMWTEMIALIAALCLQKVCEQFASVDTQHALLDLDALFALLAVFAQIAKLKSSLNKSL